VVWSPVVAAVATGRVHAVAPLAAVSGQVAGAADRPLGMAPRAPLLKRLLLAARLWAERAPGIGDVVALPVLKRLLDRPVPGATTLDTGRTLSEVSGPSGSLQLDGAGLGAVAPATLAHDGPILGEQVGVGFLVRLVPLLGLAGLEFAVGGTVGLLAGDLAGLLGLLGLLTGLGAVAASQHSGWATVQGGEQVAGLLHATGRLHKPLLVLLTLLDRMGDQPRLVGWGGVDQPGELVAATTRTS
jgi:hypothetical protein